ncbi:hypothetical protein RJT34_25033 [Clitoria ternatea]|uniref:Uncharacterized protein n=1 Tax=Clitoria ternatea TaxID=43366 RepID=A0AAN9ILC9_CLITE
MHRKLQIHVMEVDDLDEAPEEIPTEEEISDMKIIDPLISVNAMTGNVVTSAILPSATEEHAAIREDPYTTWLSELDLLFDLFQHPPGLLGSREIPDGYVE